MTFDDDLVAGADQWFTSSSSPRQAWRIPVGDLITQPG
jgi:hypothetical protein